MNPDQLKVFARRYAEDYMRANFPEVSLEDNLTNEIAKQTLPILQWLTQTYLIVEKELILNEYEKTVKVRTQSWRPLHTKIRVAEKKRLLNKLFGKSIFEKLDEVTWTAWGTRRNCKTQAK